MTGGPAKRIERGAPAPGPSDPYTEFSSAVNSACYERSIGEDLGEKMRSVHRGVSACDFSVWRQRQINEMCVITPVVVSHVLGCSHVVWVIIE